MQKLQVYVVCLSPIFGHKVNTERIENCCSLVHLSWFSFDRTADSQQPSVALDGADNSSTYPEPITSHTQLSRTHRYTHTVIQSLLIQSPSLHRQLFRAHHYTYTHTHTHTQSYPQPITSHTVIHSPSLHTQSYPEPITTQRERES